VDRKTKQENSHSHGVYLLIEPWICHHDVVSDMRSDQLVGRQTCAMQDCLVRQRCFPASRAGWVEALDDRAIYPGLDGLNRKDSLPCIATLDPPDEIYCHGFRCFDFPVLDWKLGEISKSEILICWDRCWFSSSENSYSDIGSGKIWGFNGVADFCAGESRSSQRI